MSHQYSIAFLSSNIYHPSIDHPLSLQGTHSPRCDNPLTPCAFQLTSCAYYPTSYFRTGDGVCCMQEIHLSYRGRLCSYWFRLLFTNLAPLSLLMPLGTALNPAWRSPRELTVLQKPSSAWAGANDVRSWEAFIGRRAMVASFPDGSAFT